MSKKDELFDRFLEMRMDGKSFQAIAEELEVSKQTLINWSKEDGINEKVEIERLVRIQASLRELGQHQEVCLRFYAKLSQKIQEELLSNEKPAINIDRLFHLVLNAAKRIDELASSMLFVDKYVFDDFRPPLFDFDPTK